MKEYRIKLDPDTINADLQKFGMDQVNNLSERSRRIGICPSGLHRVENKKRAPNSYTLWKYIKGLGGTAEIVITMPIEKK